MYELPPPVSIYDIAMGKLSKQLNSLPFRRDKRISTDGSTTHSEKQMEQQKYNGQYDNSKVPLLTIHSFIMAVFVSMGGFIFGYDTGQISGFLGMSEFQQRFGQKVRISRFLLSRVSRYRLLLPSLVLKQSIIENFNDERDTDLEDLNRTAMVMEATTLAMSALVSSLPCCLLARSWAL
jgi:hypothetical protein